MSTDGILLAWRGPVEHTRSVAEGETVTLKGTEYVAHFPGDGTIALSTDIDAYREQVDVREYYSERINGLWGVVILSALAAVFLLGAAYLPSRY